MTKVIIAGTPQTQWNIDGHFKPGGTSIDLTDAEIKKYKSIIIQEFVETSQVQVKEEVKKEDLDINDDGKVDEKDASLAGKVLVDAKRGRPKKVK